MEKSDPGRRVLLITPPFTQLNTPYPATACLKGFLDTRGIASFQVDLGIGVILALFSPEGLAALFIEAERNNLPLSAANRRIVALKERYTGTIGPVIAFLQGRRPELAHLICGGEWLPEAARFAQVADADHDFGPLGIHDRAKYLATLYLEDLGDFITSAVDPHFGFSRYAEQLGRSASSFDALQDTLDKPAGLIGSLLTRQLEEKIAEYDPGLVAISVPFPGNLLGALRCGQWLKQNRPGIKIAVGGGYVSTELRSLADPRVFGYADYIILDDGEAPLLQLLKHLDGEIPREKLKRTFLCTGGKVTFCDGADVADVPPADAGTPDYTGLLPEQYISVLEVANPMHRLWSDGWWNKLTLAHGCYWAQCTFCDTSLDYIKRYVPGRPDAICDRMEAVMRQTGRHGFHFTDEAAPPALLRGLALEILRRKITVAWWTNIRFESAFTRDLCLLLKKSGCIAVSGGLEVASDRILKMIGKGVTVPQVARVSGNFTRAGIMVHAYLMYGFPTQTAQETVDSLEAVRQLFREGAIQSGYWHRFAMTVHSPVGKDPQRFGVEKEETPPGPFANNDLVPVDRTGCDHALFGPGLEKSLYNFMHGICLDFPLQEWFGFRIPRTTVAPGFIRGILSHDPAVSPQPHSRILWLGGPLSVTFRTRVKKGKTLREAKISIQSQKETITLKAGEPAGKWLQEIFPLLSPENIEALTFSRFEELFRESGPGDVRAFLEGPLFRALKEHGLVVV